MDAKGPRFIQSIIGEQLSSVEFVQDYLQLHFDGPTLTLFVWPRVNTDNSMVTFGDARYRDELCQMIGHEVAEVVTSDPNSVTIRFKDVGSIIVSLRPEDRTGPETGYFTASPDRGEPLRDL